MTETKQLRVTTPQEYAEIIKSRADLVPLPSGLVVRARRAKLEGMALKGGVPTSLLRAAGSINAVIESDNPTPEQIEETNQGLIFFRELTRKNAIEPQIVYGDTEGSVEWLWPDGTRLEIEDDDFEYLAAWVRGEEVDELDSFRSRTEGSPSIAEPDRETLQSGPVASPQEQPATA